MGGNAKSSCAGGVGGVVGLAVGGVLVDVAATSAIQAAAAMAAETGVKVIAGSIFGSVIEAEAVLGCSTAAESVVLGMTGATIAGAALIIACIGVGALVGYYVYTRCREPTNEGASPIFDQAITREQVDANTILNNVQVPGLPDFHPINMTRGQFNNILTLTQGGFRKCVEKVTCQHTMQVMRQPYKMKCCQHLHKVGEKSVIQVQLITLNRCLLCQSPADRSFMILDQSKYNEILGLRCRLVKVYKEANVQERIHWQNLIDHQFGPNYTRDHLENFQFSN